MAYQRGDILLVPFPYSDLSSAKVRPTVVLSSQVYHANEPDLILAAITSQLSNAIGPLDYILIDWQSAGLRFPSAFKPVLFTLDPKKIIYQIGSLAQSDLVAIDARLRRILHL